MSEPIERIIPLSQRLYGNSTLRKALLLVVLALVWEGYARALGNPLLFPTLSATIEALIDGFRSGELPRAIAYTLTLLLEGYVLGLLFAGSFRPKPASRSGSGIAAIQNHFQENALFQVPKHLVECVIRNEVIVPIHVPGTENFILAIL